MNGEELCCKKTMCKWLRHIPCEMPLAFRIAHHWLAREAKPHAEILSKSAGKPEASARVAAKPRAYLFAAKPIPTRLNAVSCDFVNLPL